MSSGVVVNSNWFQNFVFTVTISDGYLEVQEEISITVGANSAPSFNNVTSLPTTIKSWLLG